MNCTSPERQQTAQDGKARRAGSTSTVSSRRSNMDAHQAHADKSTNSHCPAQDKQAKEQQQQLIEECAEALKVHLRLILPSHAFVVEELDPINRRLKIVIAGLTEASPALCNQFVLTKQLAFAPLAPKSFQCQLFECDRCLALHHGIISFPSAYTYIHNHAFRSIHLQVQLAGCPL